MSVDDQQDNPGMEEIEPPRFVEKLDQMKKRGEDLPEHFWNFSLCPKKELKFCEVYEFGRHQPALLWKVKHWRTSDFHRLNDPLLSNAQIHELRLMDLFSRFPEFPEKSWLELPDATRKERIKSIPNRDPILVRTVSVGQLVVSGELQPKVDVIEPYQTGTIQPMEVVWFYNDQQLVSAFKRWLKENRPYEANETRGRSTPLELLNALSALRLLTFYTHAKASDLTDRVLGKALFKTQSDWLDARRNAVDRISERPPPVPAEEVMKKLPKSLFTEEEINRLWQSWIPLKAREARDLLRLSEATFVKKMRLWLDKKSTKP